MPLVNYNIIPYGIAIVAHRLVGIVLLCRNLLQFRLAIVFTDIVSYPDSRYVSHANYVSINQAAISLRRWLIFQIQQNETSAKYSISDLGELIRSQALQPVRMP